MCYTCYEGYSLMSDGTCMACPAGCSYCTSSEYCETCLPGYFMEGTATAGGNCMPCTVGCYYCENATSCMTCGEGFMMNSVG
jgi:hypothetical protein